MSENPHRDLAEVPVDKVIEKYATRLNEAERARIMAEASVERLMTLTMEAREESLQLRKQIQELKRSDVEPGKPEDHIIEGETA